MNIIDEYEKIPADTSGSSSKNRFRLELLWGASKMFDLFDKDNFCVVFDYKCDIEVHLDNSLEFYQVKTHKIQSPYTFSTLSKQDKTNKSIIGKLFIFKKSDRFYHFGNSYNGKKSYRHIKHRCFKQKQNAEKQNKPHYCRNYPCFQNPFPF